MMPFYGALLTAILGGVAGQILLKSGAIRSTGFLDQFLNPFTVMGLGVYFLSAICYIIAIKRIPLSIAYPTVALSYFLVAVAAHYLWRESLTWSHIIGIFLIGCGIFMIHQQA